MTVGTRIFAELRGDRAIWAILAILAVFSILAAGAALVGAPLCARNEKEAWEINYESALALEAQVALTLRALGGLETAEIARAFLVPVPTMAQRLVRTLCPHCKQPTEISHDVWS